jgi:hypothetical protein
VAAEQASPWALESVGPALESVLACVLALPLELVLVLVFEWGCSSESEWEVFQGS